MTLANCPAPTTAERIRSTCVRAGGALLAVEGTEPLTTPGYASKAPTAIVTSGCHSTSRLTTSPGWARPSGC